MCIRVIEKLPNVGRAEYKTYLEATNTQSYDFGKNIHYYRMPSGILTKGVGPFDEGSSLFTQPYFWKDFRKF